MFQTMLRTHLRFTFDSVDLFEVLWPSKDSLQEKPLQVSFACLLICLLACLIVFCVLFLVFVHSPLRSRSSSVFVVFCLGGWFVVCFVFVVNSFGFAIVFSCRLVSTFFSLRFFLSVVLRIYRVPRLKAANAFEASANTVWFCRCHLRQNWRRCCWCQHRLEVIRVFSKHFQR